MDGKEVDKEKLSSVKPPEWETVPPWSHSHLACTKQGLQIIAARLGCVWCPRTKISTVGHRIVETDGIGIYAPCKSIL